MISEARKQAARYIVIACLAYIIDFGGFALLIAMAMPPLASNIIVKILAAQFGFFAHRRYTYQIKHRDDIYDHALRYFGLALIYTPLSTFCLYLLLKLIPSAMISKLTSDALMLIATYIVTTRFVFFKNHEQKI